MEIKLSNMSSPVFITGNSCSPPISNASEYLEILSEPDSDEQVLTSDSGFNMDKIPNSDFDNHNPEWDEIDNQDYFHYFDIKDQPRFNYNEVYEFAKKIGFPTDFQL